MRKKITLLVLCAAVAVVAIHYTKKASATPPHGFSSVPVAQTLGLPAFEVSNTFPPGSEDDDSVWSERLRTKGASDLYVVSNTWQPMQPGQPPSTTGWHSHPGASLVIVTVGTLTEYMGNDPSCTPNVYTAGMGFVDPGGGHVHIVRNETNQLAQAVVVRLFPAGQGPRIDVSPAPGNCPF